MKKIKIVSGVLGAFLFLGSGLARAALAADAAVSSKKMVIGISGGLLNSSRVAIMDERTGGVLGVRIGYRWNESLGLALAVQKQLDRFISRDTTLRSGTGGYEESQYIGVVPSYHEKGRNSLVWGVELGVGLAQTELESFDAQERVILSLRNHHLFLSPALSIGKEVYSGLELTVGVQSLIHIGGGYLNKDILPNVGLNYVF
ncbi:MAG: hypothetical protein ACK5QT_11560 [Oligoflexia bacterium]